MLDFRPPLDTPWLIAMVKFVMPLYMKLGLNDTTVSVSPEALERFQKLKGKRALICPNHSNRHDPQVMFSFSKLTGEDFNFIAAREVFDWEHGLNGWWLQHMGCYSVVRGAVDRESFKTTRELLATGKKKLVLFPEGEISRQNDTLLPLESGAAQLSFRALQDIKKASPNDSIYIVPMALKYTYPYDIGSGIRNSLGQLEQKLGLNTFEIDQKDTMAKQIDEGSDSVRDRLRRVAEKLLQVLEKEYRQQPAEGATMNDRVDKLRRAILQKVAKQLDVQLTSGARELEHVRVLRNTLDDYIYADNGKSEYEKKIHETNAANIKACYKDLDRAVNFIAIYDGYVTEHMTQERYSHVLDRLEWEVFGKAPGPRGARRVLIDVGEPINLDDYAESYKTKKKEAVARVTDDIFSQISSMLLNMEDNRKPIYLS
ncbi:MAG: 1-acyl-sn-glycerol-3-phosphate acyltransferase [Candidatus Obscuribacterales bacterium]|nr:1-acyl-sn-glycerol-3-phosphate acyltransferase [Candidatus Obscuribacterales bacterium]